MLATYTDGAVRDVTAEAFIESSNTEVAEVDKQGLVTAVRRGEAPMLARYEGAYAATTVIVMGDRSGFEWKDAPANNYHRRAGLQQAEAGQDRCPASCAPTPSSSAASIST